MNAAAGVASSTRQSLWMLVASLCFACMGVFVKLGAEIFSAAELVFYRGLIATVLLYGFVLARGLKLATPHWRAQLNRGLTGFVSLVLYFYAIGALPLATAVTLNYTSPVFLALLLVARTGERPRPGLVVALLVGFAGVVLLLRPSLQQDQFVGALVGLGSGLLAGIAYLNVTRLGELGEPEWRTVFYFSLIATLGGMPWVLASDPFHAFDARGLTLLAGVGVFGAVAQLAMTRAYRYGKTMVSAALAYSTVVFSSLFGVLIWHELLSWLSWLGIALIVAGGVLASLRSRAAPAEQD